MTRKHASRIGRGRNSLGREYIQQHRLFNLEIDFTRCRELFFSPLLHRSSVTVMACNWIPFRFEKKEDAIIYFFACTLIMTVCIVNFAYYAGGPKLSGEMIKTESALSRAGRKKNERKLCYTPTDFRRPQPSFN